MKNCLVSRAYCFRKLYVYIEDWIKFAFVQTAFCFSHFIFVPCLPVLAIIRSSISPGQKIEHWTSSDQRDIFVQHFSSLDQFWKTASEIFICDRKKDFYISKLKYQHLPHIQKKRKNILNRFEDRFITDRFWHQSCESHDRNIHVLWQLNIHITDYYYDLLLAQETWNDTFCGL